MTNQRRIFLKVLVTGSLVGCSSEPMGSLGSSGGGDSTPTGGNTTTGDGAASGSGGSASSSAGSSSSSAGSTTSDSGGTGFINPGHIGDPTGGSASTSGGSGGTKTVSSGGGGSGGTGTTTTFGIIQGGKPTSYAMGTLTIVGGLVLVGRDAQGLYAMSLQCTHQFCAVNVVGTELDCPCHHSRFDINGNVIQGPAITQLPHFALTVDASGNVSINRFATVSGSTRVPV